MNIQLSFWRFMKPDLTLKHYYRRHFVKQPCKHSTSPKKDDSADKVVNKHTDLDNPDCHVFIQTVTCHAQEFTVLRISNINNINPGQFPTLTIPPLYNDNFEQFHTLNFFRSVFYTFIRVILIMAHKEATTRWLLTNCQLYTR